MSDLTYAIYDIPLFELYNYRQQEVEINSAGKNFYIIIYYHINMKVVRCTSWAYRFIYFGLQRIYTNEGVGSGR